MLLLKKHLVLLVRQGKKRQTIRLWTKPNLRPNQISYTPGLGKMKITQVDVLPNLAALTEIDAQLDGFHSLAELLAEITKIYGPSPKGRTIYRIKFQWPIDPAGEKLVLSPPANPTPAKNPPRGMPALLSKKQKSHMTPAQRQTLRTHILKQAPQKK